MSRFAQLGSTLAFLAAAGSALAEHPKDQRREEISALLPGWLAQTHTPSASVALIENGKLAWTLVAGVQAPGIPANESTLYNVASLTKPVFAEVALRWFAAHGHDIDRPMAQSWVAPDLADSEYVDLLTLSAFWTHTKIALPTQPVCNLLHALPPDRAKLATWVTRESTCRERCLNGQTRRASDP